MQNQHKLVPKPRIIYTNTYITQVINDDLHCHPMQTDTFQPYAHMNIVNFMSQYLSLTINWDFEQFKKSMIIVAFSGNW